MVHVRVSLAGKALLGTELYFSDDLAAHISSLPPYDRRGPGPYGNTTDIEVRMAKGSPGSWLTVRPALDGRQADVTLQIRR
jgi:hypothetical protein